MALRYAVVTGCAEGGIGEAIVRDLLRNNFHVFATRTNITDSDRNRISDERCTWTSLDVTQDRSVESLADVVDKVAGGKLDLLVSNAGITCTRPAVDVVPQIAEQVFSTNVVGAIRMVHFLHRQIVAAKGTIALMGSVCGIAPSPWLSVYNASKAALHQFGNTLRIELEPFGVRVVVIVGGLIQTKFLVDDKNKGLAEDSLYLPLKNEVLNTWSDTSKATPPQDFAKDVVKTVLKQSPPAWYWRGAFCNILWTIGTFFPHRMFDYFYNSLIPLKKLQRR